MEQRHLGPGQEGRHPVGGAEHRARAHRQGLLQADVGDPGQAAAGRAALEPGGHVLPGRVQGLRQRGENRQRIALRRKQQVPGHHVLHDRSHRTASHLGVHYRVQRGRAHRRLPGLAGLLR
ncbi:hypothetical protein G6F63_014749 [Rhizopus arrhizus]|nr:hypothetical protein G6F63_014749 [Rhizopus arrhizus]